jgi:hypothetical protein
MKCEIEQKGKDNKRKPDVKTTTRRTREDI